MNILLIPVTCDTSHFEISPLNDAATVNIPVMSLTLDVDHFDMSPLKFVIANMWFISVILDTSHLPIGPYSPFEQRPIGARLRHALIALLRFLENRGEKTGLL